MGASEAVVFANKAMGGDGWEKGGVGEIAAMAVPDDTTGPLGWLVKGDVNTLWARWHIEGLIDPSKLLKENELASFPVRYAAVFAAVNERFKGKLSEDNIRLFSEKLEKIASSIAQQSALQSRNPPKQADRQDLWELSKGRCWVCGFEFPDWAQNKFLNNSKERQRPLFVDYLQPRGVRDTDLSVEIDHVKAISAGGSNQLDNLAIACGWCNRYKSDRSLLYDAPGYCRRFKHPTLGVVSVPQPFWVVRVLALQRECENIDCKATSKTHELKIAPRHLSGSPTPGNLMVVCDDHDHEHLRNNRLVSQKDWKDGSEKGGR